mgnify:CR=1 FL=1
MSINFPDTETLLLEQKDHALHITLNRPKARNAMSLVMVNGLMAVFEAIADNLDIRAVVLRGAEGNFCAGGDIKDMQSAGADKQALVELNRAFGHMITKADHLPAAVICPVKIRPN